jgi:hypothetical protein
MKALGGLLLITTAATFGQSARRGTSPLLQGAPYSGEEIQEHQQTLSDGTHVSRIERRRLMYRDSQGRTRIETRSMERLDEEAAVIVYIQDPVRGVQYTLDAQNKIAHRVALPRPAPPPTGRSLSTLLPLVRNTAAQPVTVENLGTQVIAGVVADGQRETVTILAGSQGNDRDFRVVTETWNSPDLQMVVYRKTSDPRSGDQITRMENLIRSEPDASLFQPPRDYQVIDEIVAF